MRHKLSFIRHSFTRGPSTASSALSPTSSSGYGLVSRSSNFRDEVFLGTIYDDDDLSEDDDDDSPRPRLQHGPVHWHVLSAVFALTQLGMKAAQRPTSIAGHAANFRQEGGYLLKALTRNEGQVFQELHAQPELRPFMPQFMGFVERDGVTYIKMQDVLLSMVDPNIMDLKIGVRTFGEEEVESDKRRMDLLQKALAIQANCPDIEITEDEKANGISKFRFMSLRDKASSSGSLGFRIQGMKQGHIISTSKDFATLREAADYRETFRSFFETVSVPQRHGLMGRLRQLLAALRGSEWFATHELVGSSILVAYDIRCPEKYGIWMIDFARTERTPRPICHEVPWTPGSHEDGYLIGVQSLLGLWAPELTPDST